MNENSREITSIVGTALHSPTAGQMFDTFIELGGVGIEVTTGSHTSDEARRYAEVARRYGFLASRGSDFHSPTESRIDLGQLPFLPPDLKPVWHDWEDRRPT